MQNEPIAQEYLEALTQGDKDKEVKETKELLEYLDTMDQKFTELIQKVTSLKETTQTLQNPETRSRLTVIIDKLELTVSHIRELFERTKNLFRAAIKQFIDESESKGKHAATKTVDILHFKQALQYVGHSLAIANGVVGALSSKVIEITAQSRSIKHNSKGIGRVTMGKDAAPFQGDMQKLDVLQYAGMGLYKEIGALYQKAQLVYKKLDGLDRSSVKKDLKQIEEGETNDVAFLEKALPKDKDR